MGSGHGDGTSAPWPDQPSGDRWRGVAGRVAVVALGIFFVLLLTDGRRLGNVHTGDTDNLVEGTRVALRCLGDGVLTRCGRIPDTVFSTVFPYPLLQYLPATALVGLGLDSGSVVDGLAVLSTVAFFGCLACVVALGRRVLIGWTPILFAILLSGPLLFYATAGFGEMLAAFTALLFVTMVVLGRPWPAAIAMVFACLGKDTVAPFLIGLGLLCVWASAEPRPSARRMAGAVLGGGAVGVALTFAFNLFRFGSPLNIFYLDPRFRVPGLGRKTAYFGALWVAPGGGLLLFWTSASALLVLAAVVAAQQRAAAAGVARTWLPLAGVLGVFVGFQAVLALWAIPFGWIAWGPRLTVPLVPAVLVAAAFTGGAPLKAAVDRAGRSVAAMVTVAVMLAASSLLHSGAVWNYPGATAALLAPAAACPSPQTVPEPPDKQFFRCQDEIMWRWRPSYLLGPVHPERGAALAAQVVLAGGLAALALGWHGGTRGRTEARSPAGV